MRFPLGGVATPEVPATEAPVEPPIAEPEVVAPPEGDAAPPDEGTDRGELIRELFKGATVDELRAALEDVPAETRSELEAEIEKRGETRAQTRKHEMSEAKANRLAAWKPYIDNLSSADGYVKGSIARMKAGDQTDLNQLERAINDATLGHTGRVLIENESYVDNLIDQVLPDLTAEEAKSLDKPLYEFSRTGQAGKIIPDVFKLALERAKTEAFAEGVKKGEGNRETKIKLAEKLAKIAEIRKQAPGVSLNGHAESTSDRRSALVQEIDAIDPFTDPQAQTKLDALKKRLKAL